MAKWITSLLYNPHSAYTYSISRKLEQKNIYMKNLGMIAWWLLVIGGLNWGLEALGMNLVEMIFMAGSTLTMVVYALVGLSAVYALLEKFEIV